MNKGSNAERPTPNASMQAKRVERLALNVQRWALNAPLNRAPALSAQLVQSIDLAQTERTDRRGINCAGDGQQAVPLVPIDRLLR